MADYDDILAGAARRSAVASATHAYVTEAAFRVAADNLQIHGGIGYTWEHDAHLYFRRATAAAQALGGADAQRERVASLIGM